MSQCMKRSREFEIVLLNNIFAVVRPTVLVMTYLGYLMKLLPTGGLLCLTSTLIFSVSLWGVSYVVLFRKPFPTLGNENISLHFYVVCLKISSKFLIAFSFIAPMDANGEVGAGFTIASTKSNAALVAAS